MISNVCKIENGTNELSAILNESDKVAVYNQLNKKQSLQLRLICEELDGMLPNIIDDYDGDFWIEFVNGTCKVNVSIRLAEFTASKKKELIGIAKNKKNAYAVGIVGKIRSAIENLFLDKETFENYDMALLFNSAMETSVGMEAAYSWSLNKYRKVVKPESQEDWDELEKSIIANLADDVIVGVKGRQANIVIVKKFY